MMRNYELTWSGLNPCKYMHIHMYFYIDVGTMGACALPLPKILLTSILKPTQLGESVLQTLLLYKQTMFCILCAPTIMLTFLHLCCSMLSTIELLEIISQLKSGSISGYHRNRQQNSCRTSVFNHAPQLLGVSAIM